MPGITPLPDVVSPERAAALWDLLGAMDEARSASYADPARIRPELLPALTALLAELGEIIAADFAGADVPETLPSLAIDALDGTFDVCADATATVDDAALVDVVLVVREAMDLFERAMDADRLPGAALRVLRLLDRWIRPGSVAIAAVCQMTAYEQIGRLRQCGRTAEAVPYSLKALAWSEPFLHLDPPMGEDRIAVAHNRHAMLLEELGQEHLALAYSERAVQLYGSIVDADDPLVLDPHDPQSRKGFAQILNLHVERLRRLDMPEEAFAASDRYLALVGDAPVALAHALDRHRDILAPNTDDHESTVAIAEAAVGTWERAAEDAEPGTYARELWAALIALAEIHHDQGAEDEAADVLLLAVRTAYAEVAADRDLRHEGAQTLARLVEQLIRADRCEQALEWSRRELETLSGLMREGKRLHREYADAHHNRAVILNALERYEESLPHSEQALMLRQLLPRGEDDNAVLEADTLLVRQESYRELRDYEAAMACCQQAVILHKGLTHRDPEADRAGLARAQRSHARLLSLTGDPVASQAFRSTMAIFEQLEKKHPGHFREDLAETLNLQLIDMQSAGESPSALLPLSERLVALEKELAEEQPGRRVTELAQAFHNHAIQLSDLGRMRDALEYSAGAVALYLELPASTRAHSHHAANYANTLELHANRLAELGMLAEGMDFSRQALAAYEELLAADRHLHLSDAAQARENHAWILEALERFDEAAEHSRRAAVMLEELLADGDPRDRQNLATTLSNLANRLMRADRVPEAFTSAERALRIREDIAGSGAPEHRGDWGVSLLNLGNLFFEHGDRGTGISYSSRSIAVFEELVAVDRDAYLPLLAQAEHNHSEYLAKIDRPKEAAERTRRAVAMREELAEEDDGYLSDLCDSLFLAVQYHQQAGDPEQAETFLVRRTEILESRVADEPEQLRELAEDRLDLARMHIEAGEHAAAAEAAARGVEVLRELVADDREGHLELLECSLAELARALMNSAPAEACAAAAESLEIARERDDPADHRYSLAYALDNYADVLCHAGEHEKALSYSDRALPLWERRAVDGGADEASDLASCLSTRSVSLAACGRAAEAAAASDRAAALIREAYDEDPELRTELAKTLWERARCLETVGRNPAALDAAVESLRHYQALAAEAPGPYAGPLAEVRDVVARLRSREG